jgi:hypothetical protein
MVEANRSWILHKIASEGRSCKKKQSWFIYPIKLCRRYGYLKCDLFERHFEETNMAKAKKKETKTKSNSPAGQPLVDTGLAAEAAAKRVAAGFGPSKGPSNIPIAQSATFKHMKDSLNKPTAGLAGMLDKTAGPIQKQANTPFHGGKQTGRNQVFGADVNRTGVPRRTGGG